ncbi:MAG: hypothetical protein MJZ65_06360 [Paludibacteraceae bacterium]|nr:hypothetical protein [Paludibacteraceae bacterium]
MTNWFQTEVAERLFKHKVVVGRGTACCCVAEIQGCGLTKRAIVQGGIAIQEQEKALPKESAANSQLMQHVRSCMEELAQEAKRQGCVYAEVRCFDDYSVFRQILEQAGWVYQPHYDVLIYPMQNIPEAKMRQINAAIRNGYSWHEAQNEDEVKAFYKCLKHLYRTKVRRPLPKESFFLNAWQQGVKVLVSVDGNGDVVGGVLMPVMGNKAYEWYICGQVMSTWAMIDYGRQHAIEVIDMMGAGEPDVPYGVRDFKLQMGGELHEWGRYVYVMRPWVYQLGKWIIQINSK